MALTNRTEKVSNNHYRGDNTDLRGNVVVSKTKTRRTAVSILRSGGRAIKSGIKSTGRAGVSGIKALGTFLDSPSSSSMPLIPFMFVLFFVASVVAVVLFNNDISFSVMLDKVSYLSDAGFDLSWISQLSESMSITSDWGVFDFLREFINFFTSVLAFGVGLVAGLVQLVSFIFGFIRMLM